MKKNRYKIIITLLIIMLLPFNYITEAAENNNEAITKTEFAVLLCNLMNLDYSLFTYPPESMTREDMSVMIVKALGYDELAQQLAYLGKPFSDVNNYMGYITIIRDLGIIRGADGFFMPSGTVTRAQAAIVIDRLSNVLKTKIDFINGFYAISSAGQLNTVPGFDSISFGWCSLGLDGDDLYINPTSSGGNSYNIPSGYEAPYNAASDGIRMLMASVSNADASRIINDSEFSMQAARMLAEACFGLSNGVVTLEFDGIVVDFEGLKGKESAERFNIFLSLLRSELDKYGKQMYVAVHPQRRAGHEYFDGYDYKTIGLLADKVILMAHDYNAKKLTEKEMEQGIVLTPLAPAEEIYYALQKITDAETGVSDKDKIILQISFSTVQWKLKDGKVINERPYVPAYSALEGRIRQGAEMKYSKKHESPYIRFYNEEDGTDNVILYEDERSVEAKIKLAELFGIKGISIWRLGNVPEQGEDIYLNVMSYILNRK